MVEDLPRGPQAKSSVPPHTGDTERDRDTDRDRKGETQRNNAQL